MDVHLYTPNEYVGGLMELCQSKRGVLIDMKYLDDVRVDLHYALPLGQIVYDFFDAIKSRSRGYASYDSLTPSRAAAGATPATTTSSRSTARAIWSSWISCSTATPWTPCP